MKPTGYKQRTIQRVNKTRSWFFVKINKIDKPFVKLNKGHRDSIQINKTRNEEEEIITETEEIKKPSDPTTKPYKLQNLVEMDDF
jgi:translation initiation factor IF-2